MNNFCNCAACDTDFTFPALDADQNCPSPPSLSQVCGLLLISNGVSAPADWTLKADWEDVIDNDDTSNSFGKYLSGVGSVEIPEKTVLEVAKGFTITTIRAYTLTYEVYGLSQYESLRKFQCGPKRYSLWIETIGGWVLGGEAGITPFLTDVDFPLGAGEGDIRKAVFTIRWRAGCDPPATYIENLSANFAGMTSQSHILGFSVTEIFGNTTSEVQGY